MPTSRWSTVCKTPSRKGYVLAVTIWIIAALFLGVSALLTMTKHHVSTIEKLEEKLKAQLKTESAYHLLTYAMKDAEYQHDYVAIEAVPTYLGTLPTRLYFKDAPQQLLPDVAVVLEDMGSLMNVKIPYADRNVKMAAAQARYLEPVLKQSALDWVDADTDKSVNGAEAMYYKTVGGQIRPRNAFAPQDVEELRFIKGFDAMSAEQWQTYSKQLFYGVTTAMNVFTMRADMLKEALRISRVEALSLVEARRRRPENFIQDVQALPSFDAETMQFHPVKELRMVLIGHREDAAATIKAHLYFTGYGDEEVTILSYTSQ